MQLFEYYMYKNKGFNGDPVGNGAITEWVRGTQNFKIKSLNFKHPKPVSDPSRELYEYMQDKGINIWDGNISLNHFEELKYRFQNISFNI